MPNQPQAYPCLLPGRAELTAQFGRNGLESLHAVVGRRLWGARSS
jgi:hypothetical protein